MKWCEIFRTGKHTDSKGNIKEWTETDLKEICSNFESKNPDVPICVGHPKTNSPAYGWIDKLKNEGGRLYASFKDVQPEFQEAVKKGLFKTRSISLTKDLIPRHIAFLGAQAPAIKGMEQFCFNGNCENEILIEFSEANVNDNTESEQSEPNAEGGAPSAPLKGEQMTEELKKQLAQKDDEINSLKEELEKSRQEALRKEFEDFCDSAISEGHIVPAQRENVLNLLFANTDTNINFDDGSSKSSNKVFKEFIRSLKQMDFQKIGDEGNLDNSANTDFSDFKAEDWEAAISEEISKAAQKGQVISSKEALNRVKKG